MTVESKDMTELIKIGDIEVYPSFHNMMSYGLTEKFRKELKSAGDFEDYYGFCGTDDDYNKIDLKRPLFYSLKIKGKFIGYIGFSDYGDVLELEIYIFKQYRNKGYGTKVLNKFIEIAFNDGLLKKWSEENEKGFCEVKSERVFPVKLMSSVRVENTPSQNMMVNCGFKENTEPFCILVAFMDDNKIHNSVEVKEYILYKKEWVSSKEG